MPLFPKKRVLILVKNFSIIGGGIPHSVLQMAKFMSEYITFDVKTNLHFYRNIAINEFYISKKKFDVNNYDSLLIAGSWQFDTFNIIMKFKKNKKIFYMPKGNLSLFEFFNLKSIYKIPYLVFVESLKILLSSSLIYTSRIEKNSSIINFISKDTQIFHDYFGKVNMNLVKLKKKTNTPWFYWSLLQ